MIRRYLVSGRVQGVGFRWFVQRSCEALGVRGYVRNLETGQVEVLAEAPAGNQEEVESLLRRGPRHASVTNVEITEISHEENDLSGFRIVG